MKQSLLSNFPNEFSSSWRTDELSSRFHQMNKLNHLRVVFTELSLKFKTKVIYSNQSGNRHKQHQSELEADVRKSRLVLVLLLIAD